MRTLLKSMAAGGLLAGPWFAAALAFYAAPLPGFRHALHPPALLGAAGLSSALAWNLLGFVAPGLLALFGLQAVYVALRADGGGRAARIGATVLSLSALAFAAQGLFPLELRQPLDMGPSRVHIAIWNLWWLAAALGAGLTGVGVRRLGGWRSLLPVGLSVAGLIVLALTSDFIGLATGWRQRLALAAWFAWIAWASWLAVRRLSRSAA